jgi:hypothetical protein
LDREEGLDPPELLDLRASLVQQAQLDLKVCREILAQLAFKAFRE